MIRYLYIFILLLCLCSCSKRHHVDHIDISTYEIHFDREGGDAQVQVSATSQWRTVVEARWLRCRYISEGIYHLTAPANDSAARAGHILFICGSDSARVDITQEAGKHLSLAPERVTLSHRGGVDTLLLTCYTQWSISSKSEWIGTDSTNGEGPQKVAIKVSPNESAEESSGSVTFISEDLERTAYITRLARPFIKLDKESVQIDGDGGYITSLYLSNYPVEVVNPTPWIRTVNHDTLSHTIYIEVLRNMEYEDREGSITLRSSNDSLIFTTLTIRQGEKIDHPAVEFAEGGKMEVGSREPFTLHPIFTDMSDSTLIWSSENPDAATVDQNGVVTVIKSGTTVIKALNPHHNLTAEIALDIKLIAEGMTIMLGNQNMVENPVAIRFLGETQKVTAILHPSDSYNEDIICYSSAPDIVSVSGMEIKCIAPGSATIYVESQYNQLQRSFKVIVSEM